MRYYGKIHSKLPIIVKIYTGMPVAPVTNIRYDLVAFEKLNNIHICIRSFLGSWKIFVFVFGHFLRGKTTIKARFLFPWTNFCRNLCKLSLRNFVSKVLWTVVFNHSFVNAGNCHSRLLLCSMVKSLWFAKCCSLSICCSIRKLVFCALFYMLCNLPF